MCGFNDHTRLFSNKSLGGVSFNCSLFLGDDRRTIMPFPGDLLIGVFSVRLMGLSIGIGDHSRGKDLLPRPRMMSSSGEGVGERYDDGRLTVADHTKPLSKFPVVKTVITNKNSFLQM